MKRFCAAGAATWLALLPAASQAATDSVRFEATATIVGSCAFRSASGLSFGNAIPTAPSSAPEASSSVSFTCTAPGATLTLSDGAMHGDSPGLPAFTVNNNYVNYVGKTDARGDAFLPNLGSYEPNTITLDSKDLPLTANVPEQSRVVVPYFRSPAVVHLVAEQAGGVTFTLHLPDGTHAPAGATLHLGANEWTVGGAGLVYVDGVEPGPALFRADLGDGRACSVRVTIPQDVATLPDLGTYVCR